MSVCVFVFCHFRMALKALLTTKHANQYYRPPPLKVSILGMIDSPRVIVWDFSQATVRPATTKNNKVVVLSDGETCSKATIFEQFAGKIQQGKTYIIKGHEIRGSEPPYYINVTNRTMFFRTAPMVVDDKLHEEAQALLFPKSILTPLVESQTAQGLLSVEGQVIEASLFHKLVSRVHNTVAGTFHLLL